MIEFGLFLALWFVGKLFFSSRMGKLLFSSPKEQHGLNAFLLGMSNACFRVAVLLVVVAVPTVFVMSWWPVTGKGVHICTRDHYDTSLRLCRLDATTLTARGPHGAGRHHHANNHPHRLV